jgi:hypothetical protein
LLVVLEAARMDGATIGRELTYVLTPMAVPGLASTIAASTEVDPDNAAENCCPTWVACRRAVGDR